MAITVGTAVYEGQAPTKSGQIIVEGGKGVDFTAYRGIATLTLDGTATTATINFIDGTEALPFTPSAVLLSAGGGTETTAISATMTGNTLTNKAFGVTLSGAGTSTKTVKVAFIVFK